MRLHRILSVCERDFRSADAKNAQEANGIGVSKMEVGSKPDHREPSLYGLRTIESIDESPLAALNCRVSQQGLGFRLAKVLDHLVGEFPWLAS